MTPKQELTNLDDDDGDISIENSHPEYSVDRKKITHIALFVLNHLGVDAFETSINFTNDRFIHELNLQYREKDSATDVLSFPIQSWESALTHINPCKKEQGEGEPHSLLGDIIISLDSAYVNAQNINQGIDREVAFLMVHGLLHLCGHDHMKPSEEDLMTKEQDFFMNIFDQEGSWKDCVLKVEV